MAQQAHVSGCVTIFTIDTIIFACEAQPFKEISGSAGAASCISWSGAGCTSLVAGLTHLFSVWPKASITLVLAPALLQILLYYGSAIWIFVFITFGAFVLLWSKTLNTVWMTIFAVAQSHIWIFKIRTCIGALSTIFQEEPFLATLAFFLLNSSAFCAIRMTFDAHCKRSCTSNGLCSHEITVLSIAFYQRIFASGDA